MTRERALEIAINYHHNGANLNTLLATAEQFYVWANKNPSSYYYTVSPTTSVTAFTGSVG